MSPCMDAKEIVPVLAVTLPACLLARTIPACSPLPAYHVGIPFFLILDADLACKPASN
jgi:hypothetical protein